MGHNAVSYARKSVAVDKPGNLYIDPDDGEVFLLTMKPGLNVIPGGDRFGAFSLRDGGVWNYPAAEPFEAVVGLDPLPSGTTITIVVGGEDED